MGTRRWLIIVLAGAAVLLLVGRACAQVYADYLWYASLGATDVWRAKFGSLLVLRLGGITFATLFVFANLYAVRQSVVSLVLPRRIGNLDIGEEVPRRQLTWTAAALSLLVAVILAWSLGDWSGFLATRVGQSFGESDPYFSSDLGFFVYRLPFELTLFTWTMTMVLVVIGIVILLYALTPSLKWESGGLYVSGYVRRHLAMLAGVLLLVLAWHYRLEMYTMLGNGSAPDGAFTSVDHRVGVPAALLLSLITLAAGITVLWAGWTGQMRAAFAALTGVIIAALAARQLAPFIASRAFADRDPAVRERPYEATRAGYTRRAFAVDRVVTDSAPLFTSLGDAAANVPVWDDGALRRATERPLSGDIAGWFISDSTLNAIVPSDAGGGAVALFSPNLMEDNGAPVRTFRSEPGAGLAPVIVVADSPARARLVADSVGNIAAPALSSSASRFTHALAMQDFRVWFGAVPSPNPKLVTRRTVRERLRALAPFFAQGNAISPVWFADSLAWAVELYSASHTYPLSRKVTLSGVEYSYFQHAATALVNATTGRVMLVADSMPDPVAFTWLTRFPSLFRRASSLPLSVRRQMPPARESARAQAIAFGRFSARVDNDVQRHVPDDEGADSALAETPEPVLAFPRLGTTGYVVPLLDRGEKVRGLFIALGGPTHRSTYYPASESSPVWTEGLDRLRAVDTVGASLLVRGFVRAVPAGDQIALVQPRYDWRGSGTPRLLYLASVVGDSVRVARSMQQLAGAAADSASRNRNTGDVATRVRRLYDEMRRAMGRNDWGAYGKAFDALGALLRERRR